MKTKWVVLTGAPSCGKTTTINHLKTLGYPTMEEGARIYMTKELERGRPLEEVRKDEFKLQEGIIRVNYQIREENNSQELIFSDRGLLDSFMFLKLKNIDSSPLLRYYKYEYSKIFILDPLPLEEDDIRTENEEDCHIHNVEIEKLYKELGYNVIRVKRMPYIDRTNYILKSLNLL